MGQDSKKKAKHARIEVINYTTACVIELKIYQYRHPDTPDDIIETVLWMDYEVFNNLKNAVGRFDSLTTSQIIIE